ncbi:DUF6069 family protein [Cellulomonas sp. McL0617]|uniref:DUF6069 family protein n=1 Tax=Cellulomonas sp. McL0617 TaxID=3415675 RepID=UPI003CFBB0AE
MSIPNPPPDRQSAYQPQPGQPAASVPPHLAAPTTPQPVVPAPQPVAPAPLPPAVEPVAVAYPVPVAPPRSTAPSVDNGRYWAGVAATAVVAALVGLVGVVILDQIIKINLLIKDLFGTDSEAAAYIVGGILCAVVAGALLQLLVMTTPRPRAFFGWIMFLALVVAALIPLTWGGTTKQAVATGLLNLIIGIAIWSLLSGVLARTLRPGSVVE